MFAEEKSEIAKFAATLIEDGDSLILAGSIPSSLPSDIYERILERIAGKKVRVVVDATKDLLLNVLISMAGFTASSLNGDYEYALRLGTATGGATAFSDGLATKEKISELLKML